MAVPRSFFLLLFPIGRYALIVIEGALTSCLMKVNIRTYQKNNDLQAESRRLLVRILPIRPKPYFMYVL